MRIRSTICAGLAVLACGCTDGATRIAYDIEEGVAAFRRSSASTHVIHHQPKAEPGGCSGAYRVQVSVAVVIWCTPPAAGETSHITSYHNRFVDVPGTFIVDKAAGQGFDILLEKRGGNVVVTGVR